MFRKLLLMSMLVMSILVLTAPETLAWDLRGINFQKVNPWCLDSLWTGLGSCDGCAGIQVTLVPTYVECQCCNGGLQCGGLGVPFEPLDPGPISGGDVFDADNLVARGRTLSSICWEQEEIDFAIREGGGFPVEECDQNMNWGPGNCFVLNTNLIIDGCGYYTNADGEEEWGAYRYITGHCNWNAATEEHDCLEDTNVLLANGTPCSWEEAPTTTPDSYLVAQDDTLSTLAPGVLANDIDPDGWPGDPLTAELVDSPARGTLTFRTNGSFDYSPDPKHFGVGKFTFTYKAYDGFAYSTPETVTITVSAPSP